MRHGMVHMKPILIALLSPGGSGAMPVVAGDADPQFVNMTSDEARRANMAITFSQVGWVPREVVYPEPPKSVVFCFLGMTGSGRNTPVNVG